MKTARSTPLLAALFVPLWSTGFVTPRLVAPYCDPFGFLALRFLFAGILLAAAALAAGAPWPRSVRAAADAAIAGVLIHGLYLGGVFWAVAHGLPSGISALVAGLQPVLTGFLARPLLGEAVSPRRWAGIAIGASGAALVIVPRLGGATEGGIPVVPLLACAMGMVSMTLGTIWQKRRNMAVDLRSGTAVQYAGALVPIAIAVALSGSMRFDISAPVAWLGLVWSILGMSIGAVLLLLVMIRRGAVAKVASLLYLVPGVSALMAYAMFGETMTPLQLGGLALAAAGVAVASRA